MPVIIQYLLSALAIVGVISIVCIFIAIYKSRKEKERFIGYLLDNDPVEFVKFFSWVGIIFGSITIIIYAIIFVHNIIFK